MPARSLRPTRRHALLNLALAVGAASGLVACGGNDEPAPSAPTITAQPQNLTLAEGAEGTMSVSATSDAGPIAYQWVNVTTGADIAGATAQELDIGPVSLKAQGTQYRARLTNTAGTTTSGNSTLTVTERSWSGPVDILPANVRQSASIVDSNGHLHVVTVSGNNLQASIDARIQLRPGTSTQMNAFAAPTFVTNSLNDTSVYGPVALSGGTITAISLAANANGFVLAAWAINGRIWTSLYQPPTNNQPRGGWQSPVNLTDAPTVAHDPVVAAFGDDFDVVWRDRSGTTGPHAIKTRHYDRANNNWQPEATLSTRSTDAEAPRVVADAAGNMLAAWRHTGEGVWSQRRVSGGAWSTTATQLDNSDLPLQVLRTNAAGRAVLVVANTVGTGLALRLDIAANNLFISGGGRAINAYGSAPDAFVDATGRVHVVGVSVNTNNGDSRLFRWFYEPAFDAWGGPEPVSENVAGNFVVTGNGVVDPRLSGADSEGNIVVTWQERLSSGDSPLSHVKARRFHVGLDVWRAIASIGDGNNLPTRVNMRNTGQATLVFGAPSGPALRSVDLN